MEAILGNYGDMIKILSESLPYPKSFLSERYKETDWREWQKEGRELIHDLMAFSPGQVPMNAKTDRVYSKDGLVYEHVSYDQPFGPRTEGILMYPENHSGKLPGIIALHDHSGIKNVGKEKIVSLEDEPAFLRPFKERAYGGRSWATEIAKRGFIVFAADVFMWGSRKQTVENTIGQIARDVFADAKSEDERIHSYNKFAAANEHVLAKSLFLSGTTWPGIMLYENMREVDYLLTRRELDIENIGCCGLSGGGLQSSFLAAMDERIKCSVSVGFMSTFADTAQNKVHCHTWMYQLPGVSRYLDFPDIYSLHGKKPLMAQYNRHDSIWTLEGQAEAHEKLGMIYKKMGVMECYSGLFYDGHHKFDAQMQEDAFAFFEKWLKAN